jgi:hypothetical protein
MKQDVRAAYDALSADEKQVCNRLIPRSIFSTPFSLGVDAVLTSLQVIRHPGRNQSSTGYRRQDIQSPEWFLGSSMRSVAQPMSTFLSVQIILKVKSTVINALAT